MEASAEDLRSRPVLYARSPVDAGPILGPISIWDS